MDNLLDFFRHIINPTWILNNGGIWVVLAVVFAETGLFMGFFLPGDSLLFVVGMSLATTPIPLFYGVNAGLFGTILLVTIAGILGNGVGYWFGKKSGPLLYKRKNSLFFKRQYLDQTRSFYNKHGAKTIVIARFLPIIRTFAPILAGIIEMDIKRFVLFNVVGSLVWVCSMIAAGFFLGRSFPFIQERIDLVVLFIVLVTTTPVFYKILRYRIAAKRMKTPDADAPENMPGGKY